MESKRPGKGRPRQDWEFPTLSAAREWLKTQSDSRFRIWVVSDPLRPGEVWYVGERSPLLAAGRVAMRFGFKVSQAPDVSDDELTDALASLPPDKLAALVAKAKAKQRGK